MFFTLSSWQLGLLLAVIMFGATIVGLVIGRILSHHAETLREPFGAVQAALLTLVGLVLAFGLAMAVGRYDSRRAAVVDDANAIGTAYLRAQLLAEPVRSRSLPLFVAYTDASLALSRSVPEQRGCEAGNRDRVGHPAAALEPDGNGRRRRADRLRPTGLHREPERDDRRCRRPACRP